MGGNSKQNVGVPSWRCATKEASLSRDTSKNLTYSLLCSDNSGYNASKGQEMMKKFKTDWLNTIPVFYNSKTKRVSNNINSVIDYGDMEFDNEGLFNYLKHGYIVFGKTPIKNVERLPPHSEITRSLDGNGQPCISIDTHKDPVLDHLDRKSTPDECIEILKNVFTDLLKDKKWDGKQYLLPLSGGRDSRMLLSFIDDLSKIQAITFDVSLSGKYSFEMVRANILADMLKFKWQNLPLESFYENDAIMRSFSQFGLEMSFASSYHVEMYEKAKKLFGDNYVVLSGSVGDWWSGEKLPLFNPNTHLEALGLFHTLDIAIPEEFIEIKADLSYNEACIRPHFDMIRESYVYRTIFSKRGRIGLASFINRAPDKIFGSITPYYDLDVAMSQLALPQEHRKDNIWQHRYFQKMGIDIDQHASQAYSISSNNSLDIIGVHYSSKKMPRLKVDTFRGIVNKNRIDWINNCIEKMSSLPIQKLREAAFWTFNQDNQRTNPPASRTGNYFDMISNHIMSTPEYAKAVSEWSVLAPIQVAVEIAEAGKYVNFGGDDA